MSNYDLDVIITTNSKNESFVKMTNNAIMSLRNSIGGDRFKIIIVETNTNAEEYPEANVTVKPNEPYQCNKFYNFGALHAESEYLLVANNDTLFDPNPLSVTYYLNGP